MVHDGRLAFESASPKQLCLVSVAYHNLSVLQLRLEVPDLACKSSQNARKIAKLCLSYSNRWINSFQWTHDAAIEDLKFLLATKVSLTVQQRKVLQELIDGMFSEDNDII